MNRLGDRSAEVLDSLAIGVIVVVTRDKICRCRLSSSPRSCRQCHWQKQTLSVETSTTSGGISLYAVNTALCQFTKCLLHVRMLKGHLKDEMCASEMSALVVPAALAFTCASVEPTV